MIWNVNSVFRKAIYNKVENELAIMQVIMGKVNLLTEWLLVFEENLCQI